MFSTRAVTILLPILSILQPILAYSVSGTFYSCTTPSYALGGTILPGNSTSPSNCAVGRSGLGLIRPLTDNRVVCVLLKRTIRVLVVPQRDLFMYEYQRPWYQLE